ncbi:MAG: type IV pilus secretin PilQ [Polyangiaceae bacterium]|nr:type IV pilus secretin PilQ [Polyangiaceae bacterium]
MRRAARVAGVLAFAAALAAPLSAAAAAPARNATAVGVAPRGGHGAAEVRVTFTSPPTFSARADRGGRRLLVDVPHAGVSGAPPSTTRKVGVVAGVLVQSFRSSQSGATTRVVVSLSEESQHAVRVEGNDLVIAVRPGKAGPIVDAGRSRARAETPAEAAVERGRVTDVRFEHGSVEQRVVVELSGAPRQLRTDRKGRSVLLLEEAELPEALVRALDVGAFGGDVSRVSSYVTRRGVVIEVEHSDAVTSRIGRRGRALVWSFHRPGALPSSATGVARDGGAARRTRTVHVEPGVDEGSRSPSGAPVESAADEAAGAFGPVVVGQARFTGRRIDLDLKDADIHNVLRLLADVGRVNIVTADNVSGSVTIRMRNVPWDQALDIVLQAKSLGMVRQGNMIRVAPQSDLEKEREMAIARRKQELELAPLETRIIPVSYARASDIQQRARDLLSPRGTIAVDDRTNVLIVRDVTGNLNQIEELTRSLDTQTPQVLVEARIVEATSRYLREVGIQWGGDTTFSGATGNPTGLAFPNSVGVVGGASDDSTPTAGLSPFTNRVATPNFAVNLPAAVGTGAGGAIGLSFGSIDNTINLAVRLSAAESTGMLRIVSSPRILTLDNREARISQGTLIPFSQVSAQGVQTTFQEAKLQLLVRPHVTADGSVSMHVKINRDEPDFNQTSARGDPTILKREAETDLLVMDGHTAVIGGIFSRNTGRNLDQVPFFGDIPLIGLLFQRRRSSDTRSELVIFLTPRIVNRAEALGR